MSLKRLIVIVTQIEYSDPSFAYGELVLVAYGDLVVCGVNPDQLDNKGLPVLVFIRQLLSADDLGAFLQEVVDGGTPPGDGAWNNSVVIPVEPPPPPGPGVASYASGLDTETIKAKAQFSVDVLPPPPPPPAAAAAAVSVSADRSISTPGRPTFRHARPPSRSRPRSTRTPS